MSKQDPTAILTATNGYILEIWASFDLHKPQLRQHIVLIHFTMPYATFIPTIVCLDLPLEAPEGPNRSQRLYILKSGHPGSGV